ncbi:MAG: hypothetical protein RBU23_09240 [Candidatus Auribacterota bacterium]|jgi:hypothetical protein|nr:hypothetical protein [Candidatus Auribacterota bacterium]
MAHHTIPFGRSNKGGSNHVSRNARRWNDYEKSHFSFDLRNILVIRSYTPLLVELVDKISEEFKGCNIDILQVCGASPVEFADNVRIGTIYAGDSKKGFFFRHLPWHAATFAHKKYDAVFLLYGMDRDTSANYNIDLYGICTPARYCIIYDIKGKYRVIDLKEFIKRTIFFLGSQVMLLINLWATLFMILYILAWMVCLSPLSLFHSGAKKRS